MGFLYSEIIVMLTVLGVLAQLQEQDSLFNLVVGGNAGNREGKGFANFYITSSEGYDIVVYKRTMEILDTRNKL